MALRIARKAECDSLIQVVTFASCGWIWLTGLWLNNWSNIFDIYGHSRTFTFEKELLIIAVQLLIIAVKKIISG
jgi:hypothetical protein